MDISVLNQQRIVVIIRHHKPFDIIRLFQTVLECNLQTIEITLNTPDAFYLIDTALKSFSEKMLIGAGTVLSMEELIKVIDIGARFIVSPLFNLEMIEYCSQRGIPVFPGALSPTEANNAYSAGAYMVKIFPASVYNSSYFRSIKESFPEIRLMAVGGVRANNVNDYLASGADAVAIGAGIIKPEWLEERNFKAIKQGIVDFQNAITC